MTHVNRSQWARGVLLWALALAVTPGKADVLPIIETPTVSAGPFLNNVFHSASGCGGACGSILAWFSLDTAATNTYDPVTGALSLTVRVFTDSSLGTQIGSAVATSSNLLASNFSAPGAQDGGFIGNLLWTFDAGVAAVLGVASVDQAFVDFNYATGSPPGNFNANSNQGSYYTLWGTNAAAATAQTSSDGQFDTNLTYIGTDLVFRVGQPVPLPAAAWLLVSGLGLTGFAVRRKSSGQVERLRTVI